MGNAKNSVDTFNTTVTNDLGEKAKAVTFFSESLKRSAFKGKSNQEEIKAKFSQYVSINQGVARIYGAQITALMYKRQKKNCRKDTTRDNGLGTRMR